MNTLEFYRSLEAHDERSVVVKENWLLQFPRALTCMKSPMKM
ncbi:MULTISPECIES: hypothetical protein [Salinivibrio]|nr:MULTISPECIES: hypothetical protein [Salinivibrio]WBA17463.1 hypothetical protein O4598_10075 [Salinivibrio kushneri]